MNFAWLVKNPVKVCMLFLALILMGLLSVQRLPLNLFPDIQTPRITVVVYTDGLTAEETERQLTAGFEQQLASIKGVSGVTSFSRDDHLVIHTDFHWGQDMEFAYLDVKKNIGALATHEHVAKVEVHRFDPNSAALMTLAFAGKVDRVQVTSLVENSLKPRLETIEGVAYVKMNGAARQEVVVHTNEALMTQYSLTPEKIMAAIRQSNISAVGGVVSDGREEMMLKLVSRIANVDDIRDCVVTVIESHPIRLGDVGRLEVREARSDIRVHQDGRSSVSLDIYREPDANAVHTARRVRRTVEELNKRADLGLRIAADRSREIEDSISEVNRTALLGMGLAALVLLVFLRNILATLVVAAALPLSIIGTFTIMYFQELSLNIMTLGGLALGTGMLVDNAIVVAENVFRHRQAGASSLDAAVDGSREVALAIIAATLTTIVVFVPLVYVHGIAGILFKDQALTVVYSLLMSLLVALIFIPMLLARLRVGCAIKPGLANRAYGGFLAASLKARWALLVLFGLIMFATWHSARNIPTRFFPESVSGRLTLALELPPGTPLSRTEAVVRRLEGVLQSIRYRPAPAGEPDLTPLLRAYEQWQIAPSAEDFLRKAKFFCELTRSRQGHEQSVRLAELTAALAAGDRAARLARLTEYLDRQFLLESVTSVIGVEADSIQLAEEKMFGPHTARMDIVMNSEALREFSAHDVAELLRTEAAKTPDLKYTFESRNEFLQQVVGRNRGDVAIEVHAERLDELRRAADSAARELAGIDGLVNVRTNLIEGEEAYILAPDRDAMRRGNFQPQELSAQVRAYLRGEETERLKLDQGEMAIVVRAERADEGGLTGLLALKIVSASGEQEAVRELADVRVERGVREIMRVNREKTLLVMADLGPCADGPKLKYQQAVEGSRQALEGVAWPVGSTWNFSGEEVKRRESFRKLLFALIIATILVYMVIASILESLIHPLTIMLCVPFATTGVVAGFLYLDLSLNLMGYIGIVILVGIVVNNAIVLLDRVRQLREAGQPPRTAVLEAARQRLRPIVMTSLTTILALVPLATGFGHGAEFRRPMAIAIIGGLASATLLTLWLLPAIYLCVEDILALPRRLFGRRRTEKA
ncbi:efflux RND transporter permease subunit [Candidatus Sumerlaeota bacterium]